VIIRLTVAKRWRLEGVDTNRANEYAAPDPYLMTGSILSRAA